MQKFTAEDPETKSADVIADNLEALKALFPDAFTEGKVDFKVLMQLLGDYVDEGDEKYGLNWHGKRAARQLALTPSTGTLRPCPEESVDWDTTQNLMIEGDNLEVLKLLQKSYTGKVKLIYIDPPYNTGGDFVYPDSFADGIQNYLGLTGQIDAEGVRTSTNSESSGRFHSTWLSMMYPRLRLARQMLSEMGLLAVHIDEHELSHLHVILAEIFGEENHLGTWVWDKRNPKGDARGIAYQHEAILLYARDASLLMSESPLRRPKRNAARMLEAAARIVKAAGSNDTASKEFREWVKNQEGLSGGERMYNRLAEGRVYRLVSMAWPNKQTAPDSYFIPLIHPLSGEPCPVPERGWRNPPETMQRLLEEGQIEFGSDASTQPQRRYFLDENMSEAIPSVLSYGGSDDALFAGWSIKFDNPKPVEFATDIVGWLTAENDIVMDFFAGSGTVGHATWRANTKFGGERRFLLVQVPEPTKGKFESIAEITKSRLNRAAEESADVSAGMDVGFRIFKLDSSNIESWEPDRDNLNGSLTDAIEHLKDDRSEDDILYELLLKLGLELTVPIETREIEGKTVYNVGAGTLLVCLAESIDMGDVEAIGLGIAEWHAEVDAAGDATVVFRDSAFADDVAKTNLTAILEQHGLSTVRSL